MTAYPYIPFAVLNRKIQKAAKILKNNYKRDNFDILFGKSGNEWSERMRKQTNKDLYQQENSFDLKSVYGCFAPEKRSKEGSKKGSIKSTADKTVRVLLVFFLGSLLYFQGSFASAEQKDLRIEIPNKTVRVGLFHQEGYHDFKNGVPVGGYGYDYLQYLRQYAPFVYEYYCQGESWSAAYRMLEEGKIDLLSNVRKTPEREKKFAFSKYPLGQSSTILTVKYGDTRFHTGDYPRWNGLRVGLLKNSSGGEIFADFAKQKGFSYKTVQYDDASTMYQDLQNGNGIDAILSNNLRRLQHEWVLEQIDSKPFYIAVRKGDSQLLAELNSAMAKQEMNDPAFCDVLWQHYFMGEQSESVTYSESEREFIQKMREIGHKFKAVLNPDRYPISYYEDGKQKGLIKDIADEIIRRTGLEVEFLTVKTPEEFRQSCKNMQTDIVFDIKYNLREAENMRFVLSRPYISLSAFILKNKSAGNRRENIVLIEGYRIAEKIKALFPDNVKIQYCQTTAEAIELVASGKCDATCLHTSAAEHAVRNDPYGRLEASLLPNTHIDLSVGVRDSRNPLLASTVNKAVASLGNDFIARTVRKYDLPRDESFSFIRLLHQHPIIVPGLPILVLLLICVFLWRLLEARNKVYRLGVVFNNMAYRYFFADESGKLLQYDYGNETKKPLLKTLDDVKDDTVRLPMKEMLTAALATGQQQEKFYVDSGRVRLGMVAPISKSLFGCPAVIGVSRDVTDLQNSKEEARKSDGYFRLTLRSIDDGVIATDKKGNIVMLNPSAERMMGVKFTEVNGAPHERYFKIISEIDGSEMESPVLRTLRTGMTVELGNHTILISADGKTRFRIADSSSPILAENGEILGAILVFRDVTGEYERRKETEAELANWEAAAKIAGIYHFKYDPKTCKMDGSKDLAEVWPSLDGVAVAPKDWICPEDFSEWNEHFLKVKEGREKQAVVKYRVIENGKIRYFRGYLRGSAEPDGEITGLVQEVTSYIEAHERQNALQSLWTTSLENMPIMLYIKSAADDFRYQLCNENYARFSGRSIDDIIGHTDADLLNRPEDAEDCRQRDLKVMTAGKAIEFHETIQDKSGKIHHYKTVKIPTVGLDGKPALLGMSLDETEDYLRRQKLDNILEDWENAANVARIAGYRLDKNMRVISATERITDFWPVSKDGIPVSEEIYLHPDDVAPYREMYRSVFCGEKEFATMFCRIPRPEGKRYLRLFIKRNAKQPNEISGLVQDVTVPVRDQKKREALLAMWKNVVDTLPALFFVKNADDNFRYLQINGKFSDQLGIKPEEIIGREEKEFIQCPEDADRNLKEDVHVMESGSRHDFVEYIHVKNGVLRQYKTVKIPFVDEKGRRILICMSQDITDEQDLFDSRKIISSAFETLFTSDNLEEDIRIILKNICDFIGVDCAYICCVDEVSNSLRMFTCSQPENSRSIFDPKTFHIEQATTLPWYVSLLNSIHCNSFLFDFSNEHERNQAKYHVPFLLSKAEEFDIHGVYLNYITVKGKPWGSIGFVSCGHFLKNLSVHKKRLLDLTAHIVELAITRKRIMDRLQKALDNALAADKAKNFFLSSMSHEIRTPLNAVIGFTDLLKDPDLDQETREDYLNAVSESSRALMTLLNDILELSKLTSGNINFHPVLMDMNEIVSEMEAAFRPVAQQKKLNLEFIVNGSFELYLDQPSIRQILFNLIGNALKFTSVGGVTVTIGYEKRSKNSGDLTLKVADTGIGIVHEDREKMFEPFIQMSKMRGTNASGSGTGLGLAIIKKIIERMDGVLSLESKVGQGSVFTVVLPNVRPNLAQKEEISQDDINTAAEGIPVLKTPLPRVLIVDDSEMVLNILARMLTSLEVPYQAAQSGKEALEILERSFFNIVITDLLMPEMNGVELAKAIRAVPRHETIKIMAMSTENESIMYDKTLFDKVMLKPIIRNVLYNGIIGKEQ